MILNQAVAERLKAELAQIDAWKDLSGSQFVRHLAIFEDWVLHDAAFKVERARQEAFLDTALNRSSVIAHAESRDYTPRKAVPSTGEARVLNTGEYPVTLLRGRTFVSDSQSPYVIDKTIVVEPGAAVMVGVTQKGTETVEHTVTETKPFYTILLDRDITPRIMGLHVFVRQDDESTFEEWTYDKSFWNAYETSKVFDEFYHFTDQRGIRFGNGAFGVIPRAGAVIRIEMETTEGDIMLLEKQYLYPLEEVRDAMNMPAPVQVEISRTVQGGMKQEGTEEIRANFHYWPVYNDRLVWDNDYTYFLRRRYPEIVFARAWGEEEAEKMWGTRLEHINKIWICAYADREGLEADVMEAIAQVPMMCRNFRWYPVEHLPFTITLKGRVLTDRILSEVREDVEKALYAAYGRNSVTRRDTVKIHEVYECVYSTGHFAKETGAWFEVEMRGSYEAALIYQMVSLDLEASVLDLAYVE